MICPNCGAVYEGDSCPYCSGTSAQKPEKNDYAQTAQTDSHKSNNTVLFVILGVAGGFLMLATVAVLFLGMTTRSLLTTNQSQYEREDGGRFEADPDQQEVQSYWQEEQAYQQEEATYDPEADKAAKNAFQQEKGVYQSGDYEVGKDIPAGTYIILSDGLGYGDFYAGVYAAPSMSDESEIYGGWAKNSRYVIVEEGQYLHFSHAAMYDPELVDITLDPFTRSGMFLVGRDLEPGTYTVVPDNDQYDGTFQVFYGLTSAGMIGGDYHYVGLDGEEEVTLSEGEFIQTDFCILKK